MSDELEANPASGDEVTPEEVQETLNPVEGAEAAQPDNQDEEDELEKLVSEEAAEGEPELVEVEIDGLKFQVPKGAEGGYLRQSDYTKKTMEVAERRKSLEDREAQLNEIATINEEARTALVSAAALQLQLKELEDTDITGLTETQKTQLLARYQILERQHDALDARAKQAMQKEQEARGQQSAKARETAAQEAAKHIKDFESRRNQIGEYLTAYGEDPQQVLGTIDNPVVWRILDDADIGRRFKERQRKAANIKASQSASAIDIVGGGKAGNKRPESMNAAEMAKLLGY